MNIAIHFKAGGDLSLPASVLLWVGQYLDVSYPRFTLWRRVFSDPLYPFRYSDWFHRCHYRNELCRATRSGPIDAFGIACEKKGHRKLGETFGLIPVFGSLAMATAIPSSWAGF